MNPEIARHLNEAFRHLQEALSISIQTVNADKSMQKPIGEMWEQFLGNFFQTIRAKGKESKLNLMSFISFPKLWKM
jgi:hypothetical protein